MINWDTVAELRIRQAVAEGKLSNLEGEGKPLPKRPGDAFVDASDMLIARIMSEAGVLPREAMLKKKLYAQKQALAAEHDPTKRRELMARVAETQMLHDMEAEARHRFMKH